MQDNKKDYRTIAIKVLKIASAVLALVAVYFALNALLSIDWEVVNAYTDFQLYPNKYLPDYPMVNGEYVCERSFFEAMNFPFLIDSAKKACFCLLPAPILHAIATILEKKK